MGGGVCVCVCVCAHQAPLSMEISRQDYWIELPFPPPGALPNPGMVLQVSYVSYIDWQTESLPLSGWYIHQSIIKLFVKHDKLHNCMTDFRNSLWSIKSQRVAALLFLKYTPFFLIVYVFLLVIFVCTECLFLFLHIYFCLSHLGLVCISVLKGASTPSPRH